MADAAQYGVDMTAKPFASTADLAEKSEQLEMLADGVYALTAEGDPNVGAVEGEDFVICIEARATPVAARRWLDRLREHTDKPIRHLVLTHYHAVRVLGASAFEAQNVIAHDRTRFLVGERGMQDWASEYARMPRLFEQPDSIPGLTWPTLTFDRRVTIPLGGDRGNLVLAHVGRGHTEGDLVAWLPEQGVLFAGDLVEARAALYTGDAFHREWSGATLDAVAALGATTLVGGRGSVVQGDAAVRAAVDQTRRFLTVMITEVAAVMASGGTLRQAFTATYAALAPDFGGWPIFEHCLPFDVARCWEELDGVDRPTIWTAERDREVWAQLQD